MINEISVAELRRRSDSNNYLAQQPGAWFTYDVSDRATFELVKERLENLPADAPVHEDDFLFFRAFDGEPGLFVDVGANMGQSAVSFRNVNRSMAIKSFEINPLLYPVLKHWEDHLEDFECFDYGISEQPGDAKIWVPVHGKFLSTPLASLRREVFESDGKLAFWNSLTKRDSIELVALDVKLRRFDDLGLNPVFIKIDVEGAEMFVLRSMESTLSSGHSIVLCEKSSDLSFVHWMGERGYRHFFYAKSDNSLHSIGDRPLNWLNIFFVHDSRFDFVRDHGVDVKGV